MDFQINRFYLGDSLSILRNFPSNSVDLCVTSPPYYKKRDYEVKGQLGQESNPNAFITVLVEVFREVKRVLKPAGSCYVNLGDTMVNKSLLAIPSRFQVAMIEDGWTHPSEIIWHKIDCKPESVKTRYTNDYEKFFFFAKEPNYYFVQQFEPHQGPDVKKRTWGRKQNILDNDRDDRSTDLSVRNPKGRNKRCVWTMPTAKSNYEHFAPYPEDLVLTPVLACCPEGGIVLDPFVGTGTTALVALKNDRRFIGIDLNRTYLKSAVKRVSPFIDRTLF